jgi:predicted pyridoxine 5'-phosphate oxidase superfamily flavin-nucleotide-binding protein
MATFHEGELEVQRRAGVLANAEKVGRSIHHEIPEAARRFAAERSFVLVGSADAAGRVWASVLQGPPGFLSSSAPDRLHVGAGPWAGDPLADTLSAPADVGLLLIEPATRRRMRLNGRAAPDGGGGFDVTAREVYANCPKYIHPREARLPDAVDTAMRSEHGSALTPAQATWLERTDTLFLASRHPVAGADVSHRGGEAGFVRVPAADRVLIPDYAGNMMFNTLGNLAADPRVGLAVVDFETGATLQLTGRAAIEWDAAAVAAFPGAQRLVELTIEEVVATRRRRARHSSLSR